jgi:hypothetical protein
VIHIKSSRRLMAALLIGSLLNAGCGTMYPRYLGIRPDAPEVKPNPAATDECNRRAGRQPAATADTPTSEPPEERATRIACEQYLDHVVWARQLAESYRTRATMNEWAIYLAGTIALAGLSVVSGLGLAAAASTETLGLVGVSTGFTSGFFGFMNNSRRAGFYTAAANDISSALAAATQIVGADPTKEKYDTATKQLAVAVANAARSLETERYQAAADAAKSKDVQDAVDKLKALENAQLLSLDPLKGKPGIDVVAKVAGIDLTKYKDRVKVWMDGDWTTGEVTPSTVKFKMTSKATGKVNVRLTADGLPIPGEQPFTIEP